MNKIQESNYRLLSTVIKPVSDLLTDCSISNPQLVPEHGPGIVVANHRCDIDPFFIMTNIRRPVNWIGASYVWNIPFLNYLMDGLGAIPISRFQNEVREAIARAVDCLDKGQLVGIFPEGWNYIAENRFDWSVGAFQTGFARIAFQTGAPVIPMALLGLHEVRGSQGWDPRIRKLIGVPVELQYIKGRVVYKKLHINVGRPVPVPEGADPEDYKAVKAFSKQINEVVRDLYNAIPQSAVGNSDYTPVTAVKGMGKPLADDEYAEDILDAAKMVRRAAHQPETELDWDLLERLQDHRPGLLEMRDCPDRNKRAMAVYYVEWIDKIQDAAEQGTRIKEWFQQYLRRYSA